MYLDLLWHAIVDVRSNGVPLECFLLDRKCLSIWEYTCIHDMCYLQPCYVTMHWPSLPKTILHFWRLKHSNAHLAKPIISSTRIGISGHIDSNTKYNHGRFGYWGEGGGANQPREQTNLHFNNQDDCFPCLTTPWIYKQHRSSQTCFLWKHSSSQHGVTNGPI